ncbi:MAG TPA: hypothetical protein VNT79_09500 [Phycisphaerae bacterium]|nr:hypothetical protein [Phycisphaerae bacterium]
MTIEQLQTVQKAEPFRPYQIHMADGRSTLVSHPDLFMGSPSGSTAIVYNRDNTFEVIDLSLVTSLEVLNQLPRDQRPRRRRRR